jgi:hypothetical protein
VFEVSEMEQLVLARAKTPHFTAFHVFFLENPQAIPFLIELAFSAKQHPVPAYSAWLLVHIAKAKPQLLYKFQAHLEDGLLQTSKHDVQRSMLVVLLHLPLRRQNEGVLLELYFTIFQDQDLKVANRVYALYHLKKMLKKYPEIDTEIKAQISIIQELGDMKPALKIGIRNYLKGTTGY